MKFNSRIVLWIFALVVVAGCASTQVTQQSQLSPTTQLVRPKNIWVYDFIATPADSPQNSDVSFQSAPQTLEQIEIGRLLGAQIADELIADIQAMGLPAAKGTRGSPLQPGDIVIRGYLVSIDEGSAVKRVAIGFGAGSSELSTAVEGYQVTPQGLRKLGSGTVDAGGSKTPGAALPAVVAIASGNPVGLIVSSGMKVYGEASGSSKVVGRAKQTADEVSEQLRIRFRQQGWI